MIRLEELHGDKGARQKRKRLGRGEASGQGKTSGKGHKGRQARSGGHVRNRLEGGQMPLTMRVPKRGFSNQIWDKPVGIVNLDQLNTFDDGATVDWTVLRGAGMVGKNAAYFKVLGTGEITKKVTVVASAFSASARQKIEAAGGVCEVAAGALNTGCGEDSD